VAVFNVERAPFGTIEPSEVVDMGLF
jgi:hypothetical protein